MLACEEGDASEATYPDPCPGGNRCPCVGCSREGTRAVDIHSLGRRVYACETCVERTYRNDPDVTVRDREDRR